MIKNINEEVTIRIEDQNYNIQKTCPVYDIILSKLRQIFKKKNKFIFPNNINKIDFDIYSNVLNEGVKIVKNIKDIFSGIKVTILLKDKETFNELISNGLLKLLEENKNNSSIENEFFILKNIDDDYNYEYDTSIFDIISKKCINNIVNKLSNSKNLTDLNLNCLMQLPQYKHRLIINELIKKNFYIIDFEKNNFDLKFFLKNIFQIYDTNDNLFFVLNKEREYSINEFKYKISNGDILPSISLFFQKDNNINYRKIDDLNIEISQIQKNLSEKNFCIKILNQNIFNKKPCCILCKTNITNKVYFNCFFPNQSHQIYINIDSSFLLISQKKNQQFKIYFEVNYTYSIFLHYICSNFNIFYEKNFDFLPKNIFLMIIKNNKFPKESLFSLFKWCINQNSLISEEEIIKIIENIKLNNLSIDSFFEILLNYGFYISKYKKLCELLKEFLHQKFYITYNKTIHNFKYEYLLNIEIGKNESENIFDKLIKISIQNNSKIDKNIIKKNHHSSLSFNDTSFSNSYQNNFLTSNQNLTSIHNNNISTNNTSVLVNSRNNNNQLKKLFNSQIYTNDFKGYISNTTEQKKIIYSYNNSNNNSKSKNKNNSANKILEKGKIEGKNRPKSESSLKSQLEKIKEKLYLDKMNKRLTSYKKRNNIKFIKK